MAFRGLLRDVFAASALLPCTVRKLSERGCMRLLVPFIAFHIL
jgi:hypothetical protein